MNKDKGSSPIELALGLMLIVLPIAIVVLLVAPVFEARNFVRRAAAEAARAGVLAVDDPLPASLAIVEHLAQGLDIASETVRVEFCDGGVCSWGRGATFVVEVSVEVTQISELLPIGSVTVSAQHGEQVDLYRSRP
jgi:hypothetical protein